MREGWAGVGGGGRGGELAHSATVEPAAKDHCKLLMKHLEEL